MGLAAEWAAVLRAEAPCYAQIALATIRREFPARLSHTMARPGDFPHRPRAWAPVFYGSYEWHWAVAAHWLLVRLLRAGGQATPARDIRGALNAQFGKVALAKEADHLAGPAGAGQCPHGWGWALALAHEAGSWDDPEAQKWSAALAPLADAAAARLLAWLPAAAHPVRHGVDANSAAGLSRALGYARWRDGRGEPDLLAAITTKALDWYGGDTFYPAGWEPSGTDVLSPALAEAELMAQTLPGGAFADWLSMFLPGIGGGEPAPLFTPAAGAEGEAGPHCLNASRASAWRRVGEALPNHDPRRGPVFAAARAHAAAALPHVADDDYLVAHRLPALAALMLS